TLLLRIEGEQGLQLAVDTQGQTYSAGSLYLDQNSLIASPLNSRSPNSLLLCDDQNNCQLTAPESTLSLTAKAIQLNGTLEHEDIGFWKKVKTNPSDIYFASGTVSIGTDTSSDAQLYVKATGDAKGPSLQVDGLTNLATLTVSGSATISNTLKVSKSATISDTLLIEGNTAIHTAGVENSNLTVYKNFDNKITSQSTAQFISSKITSIHFKSTDNITTSINAIDKGTKNDKEVSCFMPIKVDHDGRYLFYLDYNGHVYQSSDQNLKTHIRLLDDALDKVRALQGVSYLRSDSAFQGKRQIGLIAQEVEKVLPELVSTHQDGTKFVAYVPLIPVLLEAIKVLDTKVSAMENLSRKKESLLQSIVNRFVGLA
ncbi:MAG: tail fiber domain-containing protein, partial [Candidatus Tectomicrobia bacterium]|nr:tail fiber domain-containing protein [Candidatus Tectomicrobia bacterium]